MVLEKLPNETEFEHKWRLCKAKLQKEIDYDWQEIVNGLGIDVSADHLRKTAYGMMEMYNYLSGGNDAIYTCILSISDLHVPFELNYKKLEQYAGCVDILQINGDILDCASLSKFPKMHRSSSIEEMILARKYLIDLINYIKPKKVVATWGNHDARLGSYLARNIDNDIQELMPTTSIDYIFDEGFTHHDRMNGTKTYYSPLKDVFSGSGIDIVYDGEWYCQIGDAIFCHPKTFSSAPLKTAEKALYWFRNEGFDFKNLVMAHTHRIGQYKIGNSNIYEQGAFCHTEQMQYADGLLINSQKQGFIVLYQDENGRTIESKTKIVSLN